MILEFIWVVEHRSPDGWEVLSVPVTEWGAESFIAEVAVDVSPRDFRKVAYKRIDPEETADKPLKAPPEMEHVT